MKTWVQYGSWAICKACGSAHRQRLNVRSLTCGSHNNTLDSCAFCSAGYYVPTVHNYPMVLMRLSPEQVNARRPLHLFQGAVQHGQYGFRRHVEISKLKWAPTSVTDKIEKLPEEIRDHTFAAYNILMSSKVSSYRQFVQDHQEALATGDVGSFLSHTIQLKKYLECALWPNLYPTSKGSDTAIYGRHTGKKSVKQAYFAKVCSRVLDYALRFDLL